MSKKMGINPSLTFRVQSCDRSVPRLMFPVFFSVFFYTKKPANRLAP